MGRASSKAINGCTNSGSEPKAMSFARCEKLLNTLLWRASLSDDWMVGTSFSAATSPTRSAANTYTQANSRR